MRNLILTCFILGLLSSCSLINDDQPEPANTKPDWYPYTTLVNSGLLMQFDKEYAFFETNDSQRTVRGYLMFHQDTSYTERLVDSANTTIRQHFYFKQFGNPGFQMFVDLNTVDSSRLLLMDKLILSKIIKETGAGIGSSWPVEDSVYFSSIGNYSKSYKVIRN